MDNVEHYGRHCYVLSFRKAIEQGIICDYKIVFPEVNSEMLAKELEAQGDMDLSNNALYNAAMQIALKKAIEKTAATKIISFHTMVKDAEQFSNSLINNRIIPGYNIFHVNGKQASGTRKTIMREFEKKAKSLITNARCLTEGIDAPSVDMVAIFSNKKSKIDIIQGIGRALRKDPNKQYGYIVVPIFVDTAANETMEDALAKPGSEVLFEVLLALEQQDELLGEAIRKTKFMEGYVGDGTATPLDSFFDTVVQKHLSSQQFTKALSVAIVDRLGSNWDKMVGCLVRFKNQYGHCNVSAKFNDNKTLANWVGTMRQSYKKGMLARDRIQQLEELGFNWDPLDVVWNQRITELLAFKKQNGHCNVPSGSCDNPRLASWVGAVRYSYKNGKLTQDKIQQLEKLGFIWNSYDARWNQRVTELLEFKKKHGYYNVSAKFNDNKTLANWVGIVRQSYKRGILSLDKIQQLEKLGFGWSPYDTRWDLRVAELVEFKKKRGDCNVPSRFHDNPTLGMWMSIVRRSYKKGTLTRDKIQQLEKLGFIWNPHDVLWNRRVTELLEFKEKHEHCNVPRGFNDNHPLANWVNTVRKLYKKKTLIREKIQQLEKLGFNWRLSRKLKKQKDS